MPLKIGNTLLPLSQLIPSFSLISLASLLSFTASFSCTSSVMQFFFNIFDSFLGILPLINLLAHFKASRVSLNLLNYSNETSFMALLES